MGATVRMRVSTASRRAASFASFLSETGAGAAELAGAAAGAALAAADRETTAKPSTSMSVISSLPLNRDLAETRTDARSKRTDSALSSRPHEARPRFRPG